MLQAGQSSRPETPVCGEPLDPDCDSFEISSLFWLPGERSAARSQWRTLWQPSDFLKQANSVDWTSNPYEVLVSNAVQISKLLRETREYVHPLVCK